MRRESLEVIKATLVDAKGYTLVRRFVNHCIKAEDPVMIIFFGSLRKGEPTEDPDTGVAVIYEHEVDPIEKSCDLRGVMGTRKIDTFAYSKRRLLKMIDQLNPFIVEALRGGVAVHICDELFYEEVQGCVMTALERVGKAPMRWEFVRL